MTTWRLSHEVQVARDRGGMILFHVSSGQLHSLTPIGGVILDRVIAGRPWATIIDDLEHAYREPRARLESDALLFMQDLVRKGLCDAHDE
jgi:hypothetical protein